MSEMVRTEKITTEEIWELFPSGTMPAAAFALLSEEGKTVDEVWRGLQAFAAEEPARIPPMVARVAEALRRLPIRDCDALGGELDALRLREAARAAIEAMREPTLEMMEAWRVGMHANMKEHGSWRDAYDAMINAMLRTSTRDSTGA